MTQLPEADRGASNLKCTCPSGDGSLRWPCPQHPAAAEALLRDAMIDIETLGKKPGCAVLSIGAVMFGAAGLGEAFYEPVLLQSCTDVGLTIDPETVAWWMKQSDAARQAAFRADAPALPVVLQRLSGWFVAQRARYPWCHGATFDVPILEAAYAACGLPVPWKFYDVRDTRTLYDLAGVKVDRSQGTHHNALDDAKAQADAAVKARHILIGPRYVTANLSADIVAKLREAAETRSSAALLENGSAVFVSYGDQPEDTAHLSCTTCGGSGHIDDQLERQGEAGRFAWAAFAANGNVIIWSHRRDQVKQVADRYCTPIRAVVVLQAEDAAWTLASVPPDADTTVMLALADGEVWQGHFDGTDWIDASGLRLAPGRVTYWMHTPGHPEDRATSATATPHHA